MSLVLIAVLLVNFPGSTAGVHPPAGFVDAAQPGDSLAPWDPCTAGAVAMRPDAGEMALTDPGGDGFCFFPDGRRLIATRRLPGAPNAKALVEYGCAGGQWDAGAVLTLSGGFFNLDPFVSPDGQVLVFLSFRPPSWNMDLWAARRTPAGWSVPVALGRQVNSAAVERSPAVAAAGHLYFLRGDTVWRAERPADAPVGVLVFRDAEPLAGPLNASGQKTDLSVAPDERHLVYTSHRAGGSAEGLFVSENRQGTWSAGRAVVMPPNVDAVTGRPVVSADGRWVCVKAARAGLPSIVCVAAQGVWDAATPNSQVTTRSKRPAQNASMW